MNFFFSKNGKIINKLFNNIDDWETDGEFWVIHKSGISLWIGNGASHFNGRINSRRVDDPTVSLGKIERRFLYRKAMKIVNKQKSIVERDKINNLKSFINNWKENENK